MDMNPNVMMDLARMGHEERLVSAQKARLVRSAAPEAHAPLEPPAEVHWRRWGQISAP
jgi:hypothetical protein